VERAARFQILTIGPASAADPGRAARLRGAVKVARSGPPAADSGPTRRARLGCRPVGHRARYRSGPCLRGRHPGSASRDLASGERRQRGSSGARPCWPVGHDRRPHLRDPLGPAGG